MTADSESNVDDFREEKQSHNLRELQGKGKADQEIEVERTFIHKRAFIRENQIEDFASCSKGK